MFGGVGRKGEDLGGGGRERERRGCEIGGGTVKGGREASIRVGPVAFQDDIGLREDAG